MSTETVERPWYKPAVDHANVGCLNCGAPPIIMPPDRRLSVGFGQVAVFKDDECLWSGDDWEVSALPYTTAADKHPEHDWRIQFDGPLHGETYQHQNGQWVMIETNQGFA